MAPPMMHGNGMSATGFSQQSPATPAFTMSGQQTMRTPTMGQQQSDPTTGIPSSWNPSEADPESVLPAMQKSPPRSASTHSPEGSQSLPFLQTTLSGLRDPDINGIHAPSPYAPLSGHSPQFVRHSTFSPQSHPALFDPSDPALFNSDLATMNFGNHYGALEFSMPGHMTTGANATPSEDDAAMIRHQASSRTEIASREATMLLPSDITGKTTSGTRVGASEPVSLHPDQISPTSSHTFNQNTQFSTVAVGPYTTQSPQNTSSASFTAYPLFCGDKFNRSLKTMGDDFTAWLFNPLEDVPVAAFGDNFWDPPEDPDIPVTAFDDDSRGINTNLPMECFGANVDDESNLLPTYKALNTSLRLKRTSPGSNKKPTKEDVTLPLPSTRPREIIYMKPKSSAEQANAPNGFSFSQTGPAAQNNKPGVVPYRRHTGTLSKSPDDDKGAVDLGQRRSPFLREGRLFDLPLLLGDQEILAVPDTGAQINAISVQTLKRLRGQFQSQWGSLDDAVDVANSSSTDAICQVTIHCRLTQASLVAQFYPNCVFHVFSELASGVMAIIGRAFLDAAQILTTRSYLLRERVDHLQYIPRCMSIGPFKSSGLRLPVYLDSKLITAFPDTGSEIDLISRACALLHRFDIQKLQVTDKSVVQFADGQIDTLSGKVRVKFDTFTEPVLSTRSTLSTKRDEPAPLLTPSRKKRKTSGTTYLDVASSAPPDHHRTFYVLDSLPYDVVLSQSLLHSIDAFNLHASGFTTVTPEENKKEICTVFWYRGKEYKAEETR